MHTFHIPVMGLSYTIDTPLKVARFGISSVISIVQDDLLEQMREYYCKKYHYEFTPIQKSHIDHRALRVTAYLELMQDLVNKQIQALRSEPFEEGKDIVKYFRLLPEGSAAKLAFLEMWKQTGEAKKLSQACLRDMIRPGSVDVNIMTKVDNLNYSAKGELLPPEYSDASAALRGFANSSISASIVFSAGLNPRLFSYIEKFADFFPDADGQIRKKIILKVSDYRSALIQGKLLAKKGLLVSEFRIESGLNCGGHAFPTEGHLMGPILEEFKAQRHELNKTLIGLCNQVLLSKNQALISANTQIRISAQGGLGTAHENQFLLDYYALDATGWGSPFLLVPEATNVDERTLNDLSNAQPEDYYLSEASPLGVPFNNFRRSTSEQQRKARIDKNRPGSPCYKKLLAFNTEFTEKPICTASREYQHKKLKSLQADPNLNESDVQRIYQEVVLKDCLCEGLAASALVNHNIPDPHGLEAVTICPGPNLAYFSKISSLEEMVGHIYGRFNILNARYRSHFFVNELRMYVDYLKKELDKNVDSLSEKQRSYFSSFKGNLLNGIEYYKGILSNMHQEAEDFKKKMALEFDELKSTLNRINTLVVEKPALA